MIVGERGRMPPELRRGSPRFGGRSPTGQPRGTSGLKRTLTAPCPRQVQLISREALLARLAQVAEHREQLG